MWLRDDETVRSHSRFIFKIESAGFPKGSGGAPARKRRHQSDSGLGFTSAENGVSVSWDEEGCEWHRGGEGLLGLQSNPWGSWGSCIPFHISPTQRAHSQAPGQVPVLGVSQPVSKLSSPIECWLVCQRLYVAWLVCRDRLYVPQVQSSTASYMHSKYLMNACGVNEVGTPKHFLVNFEIDFFCDL